MDPDPAANKIPTITDGVSTNIGTLVGFNYQGTIENCAAYGINMRATGLFIGGLVVTVIKLGPDKK